ncbi:MAG: glutamate-1-semialdehyde 2,1-aminomutase, partial [Gammaproteobacteria bacterium]|nr:glutamate-1-semialdehyde 2,1-aminomutase [Gammaproteobacteria bacterium]
MKFSESDKVREKAHQLIPGGCHTYAKGDDQFPQLSPGFIARGLGCHVWDVDGNEFIEYGMGLRSVTLGHAFQPVVNAAARQMQLGNNYTRPAAIEVSYAEELVAVIPCADMVKFAKDGSTVTTAAIKLARAYTGRNMVALCKDHPFFSYNDWFIGTTPMRGGIPESAVRNSLGFGYNDIASITELFDRYPGQIAAVILEPERDQPPVNGFLEKLKTLSAERGAVLIFDEMITGFRWAIGGGQQVHGVLPDLATYGKAIANGFALSALAGRRDIMELGGIRHDGERVFLLSTTHGAENHALAAAQATLEIYRSEDVVGHLHRQGMRLTNEINEVSKARGTLDFVQVMGHPSNLFFTTRDNEGMPSQTFRTLMLQELIRNGVIAPSLV